MTTYRVLVPSVSYGVEEVEAADPYDAVRKIKAGAGSPVPELDGYDLEPLDVPELEVTDLTTGLTGRYGPEAP